MKRREFARRSSGLKRWRRLRLLILERDGWRCRACGWAGRPRPELRFLSRGPLRRLRYLPPATPARRRVESDESSSNTGACTPTVVPELTADEHAVGRDLRVVHPLGRAHDCRPFVGRTV